MMTLDSGLLFLGHFV